MHEMFLCKILMSRSRDLPFFLLTPTKVENNAGQFTATEVGLTPRVIDRHEGWINPEHGRTFLMVFDAEIDGYSQREQVADDIRGGQKTRQHLLGPLHQGAVFVRSCTKCVMFLLDTTFDLYSRLHAPQRTVPG